MASPGAPPAVRVTLSVLAESEPEQDIAASQPGHRGSVDRGLQTVNHRAGFDQRAQVAHLRGGWKDEPQPAARARERRRARAGGGVRVAGVTGHPGPAKTAETGHVD